MTAPKWQYIYEHLPTNGQTVWIRLDPYSNPTQAIWTTAAQTWTTTSGLVSPWYSALMWRAL